MSAGQALVAAAMAALATDDLAPLVVFDAPPVRAGLPYGVIDEPQFAAADAAGVKGRIGTLAVSWFDGGERPMSLRARIALAEALIDALPSTLGDGWRLAGIALARSRLARTKDGWMARSEWAVRVFRVN